MEPYLVVLALIVAGLGASSLLARRRHAVVAGGGPSHDLVVDVDPARWEPAPSIRIEPSAEERTAAQRWAEGRWTEIDPLDAADRQPLRSPVAAGVAPAAVAAPAVMAAATDPASSGGPPPLGNTAGNEALDELWRAVRSTPATARGDALARVERLPAPALVAVAAAHARDADSADRILAVIFARLAGEPGVPMLLRSLIDQAPRVRQAAALGLSDAAPTAEVIRALSATARDDLDPAVRAQAMSALHQLAGS